MLVMTERELEVSFVGEMFTEQERLKQRGITSSKGLSHGRI